MYISPYGSLEERFMAKVRQEDGCWMWTANLSHNGYGRFWFQGRNVQAHHMAWELFVGPTPDGLEPDHLCRTPACVNPSHLEWVTHRENMLRGNTVAARNAARTDCVNGHAFDDSNTYWRPDGRGRQCRRCIAAASERYARKRDTCISAAA